MENENGCDLQSIIEVEGTTKTEPVSESESDSDVVFVDSSYPCQGSSKNVVSVSMSSQVQLGTQQCDLGVEIPKRQKQCRHCGIIFLDEHICDRICSFCDKPHTTKRSLLKHQFKFHWEKFICPFCTKAVTYFTTIALEDHVKAEHQGIPIPESNNWIWHCHICKATFKVKTNVLIHFECLHKMVCGECCERFLTTIELEKHLLESHFQIQTKLPNYFLKSQYRVPQQDVGPTSNEYEPDDGLSGSSNSLNQSALTQELDEYETDDGLSGDSSKSTGQNASAQEKDVVVEPPENTKSLTSIQDDLENILEIERMIKDQTAVEFHDDDEYNSEFNPENVIDSSQILETPNQEGSPEERSESHQNTEEIDFRCFRCERVFDIGDVSSQCLRIHHVSCEICSEIFSYIDDLKTHLENSHSNVKPMKTVFGRCKHCQRETSNKTECELEKPPQVKVFGRCKLCKHPSTSKDDLVIHFVKKHPDIDLDIEYKCPGCNLFFEKQYCISLHSNFCHQNIEASSVENPLQEENLEPLEKRVKTENIDDTSGSPSEKPKILTCSICTQSFCDFEDIHSGKEPRCKECEGSFNVKEEIQIRYEVIYPPSSPDYEGYDLEVLDLMALEQNIPISDDEDEGVSSNLRKNQNELERKDVKTESESSLKQFQETHGKACQIQDSTSLETANHSKTVPVQTAQNEPKRRNSCPNIEKDGDEQVCKENTSGSTTVNESNRKNSFTADCNVCKESFPTTISLTTHFREKHPGLELNFDLFECIECDICFETIEDIRLHFQTEHNYFESYGNSTAHSSDFRIFGESDISIESSDTVFELDVPSASNGTRRQQKKRFKRRWLNTVNAKCNICHRLFSTNYNLRRHFDKMHPGFELTDIEYKCKLCEAFFKTTAGVKEHTSSVHNTNVGLGETQTFVITECEREVDGTEFGNLPNPEVIKNEPYAALSSDLESTLKTPSEIKVEKEKT